MTIEEACSKSKSFCLEKTERDGSVVFSLKKRHDYSYQIQCQMYCCDESWCDFVVRTEKDLHVERILEIQSGGWNSYLNYEHFILMHCYLSLLVQDKENEAFGNPQMISHLL